MSSKRAMSQKQKDANAAQKAGVLAQVAGITASGAVQKITEASLSINQTLSGVSSSVMQVVEELSRLDQAIAIKTEELAAMHGREVILKEVDQLQVDFDVRKAELEAQIEEIHRSVLEANAASATHRMRDEEQYQYNLTRQRQRDQDEFKSRLDAQERIHNNYESDRVKQLDERAAALKVQEDELKTLREQVANFPGILAKEKEKAAAIAGHTVKSDFETKLVLAGKDLETTVKVMNMDANALRAQVASQKDQITSLQKSLDESQQRVQAISEKALEMSGSAKAMAEVQTVLANRNEQKR